MVMIEKPAFITLRRTYLDDEDKNTMTPFSLATVNNPEWDKKIRSGLLKEVETLTSVPADFKTHSIYLKNKDTFAGGISFEHHGDILWIDSLWIEPAFRKQGAGRRLLQEVQLFTTQKKAKEIQLNTFFPEAHAFFLRCGFEDVASIPNWKYGLTCYFMKKKI